MAPHGNFLAHLGNPGTRRRGGAAALALAALSGCASLPPGRLAGTGSPGAGAAAGPTAAPVGSSPRAPAAATPGDSDTRTLAPYRVNDTPVQSFGFTVTVFGNPSTHLITAITVARVWPNGPGDRAGLRPGTAILKIDGKAVQDMVASFKRGSDLNRLLMNRRGGERVRLQIARGSFPPEDVVVVEAGGAIPGISGL